MTRKPLGPILIWKWILFSPMDSWTVSKDSLKRFDSQEWFLDESDNDGTRPGCLPVETEPLIDDRNLTLHRY